MTGFNLFETSHSHEERADHPAKWVRLRPHRRILAGAVIVALALHGYALLPQPARAASATIEIIASADNGMIYDTTDEGAANRVYPTGDLAVGCFWILGAFQNDWICFNTALKFDLPAGIAGSAIYGATLRLYGHLAAESFDTQYRIAAFAGSWSPSSITMSNQPNYYTGNQAYIAPPLVNPVEIDVTGIVGNWASGTWSNNGFLLADTSVVFPWMTLNRVTYFYSSDFYDAASHRPTLIVSYEAPSLPVISFSASPSTIGTGGSSELIWSSSNATGCTIAPFLWGPSGSMEVSPASTTTYTITCTGPGGSRSATTTVTVSDVPIVTVWADDTTLVPGESTTVRWTSTGYALSCTYYRVGNLFGTNVANSGSSTVTPSTTSTYRVSCTNPSGSNSDEVMIYVPEPSTTLLSACALLTLVLLLRRKRAA